MEKITIKQLEKKLKLIRICLYISYLSLLIIILSFFALLVSYNSLFKTIKDSTTYEKAVENVGNVTINFTDLNEEEIKIANNLILSMKDIYLLPQKSITFSHNISDFYGDGYNENTTAFYRKGNIYIKWRNNTGDVAVSVCHEALHHFTKNNGESHKIVYDVSEYLTCFEETKDD